MKRMLALTGALVFALALGPAFVQAGEMSGNGITYFDKDSGSAIASEGFELVLANGITVTEPAIVPSWSEGYAAGSLGEEKPSVDLHNGITVLDD